MGAIADGSGIKSDFEGMSLKKMWDEWGKKGDMWVVEWRVWWDSNKNKL